MDELVLDKDQTALPNSSGSAAGAETAREEIPRPQDNKSLFIADLKDSYFALFAFILGFLFARWVLFSWQGWGVSLFTLLYCASVTIYLLKKGVHLSRSGWFWLITVLLLGLSYGLWANKGLAPWHGLVLFGSAVYWIISATGLLILKKTSNFFCWDGINALLAIPFGNYFCQYKSLALLGGKKSNRGKDIFSVLLGLFITFIIALLVFPLLIEADSGGFIRIVAGISSSFHQLGESFQELLWQIILAVPIAAYIFGLVAGSAHKSENDSFKSEQTINSVSNLRLLPLTTVYILLGFLCLLYIIFIGSQIPYFFSAFIGQRPEGWQVYSEYARSGFFELCRIAVINLLILTAANVMGQPGKGKNTVLKILNALLALLTLVLIATAFSKMALYIGAYGLSMRRLLPCVFMLFMAVICGGIIALQKWRFSITRLAVGVGMVMFCSLCLINPDSLVARYNADRYLAGTLNNFDVEILYRSGPAGVAPALKVYEQNNDRGLKEYLLLQQQAAEELAGTPADSLERAIVRMTICSVIFLSP